MKPWHLIPKDDRDHVLSRFRNAVEWSTLEAGRAAIALLESAAPYGDDELVVRDASDGEHVWVVGWDVMATGTPVLEIVNRDGEFWMRTEEVEPLTPAAASLLDALRGE